MALIKTPHAAVIVWNYEERISTRGLIKKTDKTAVNEVIISTVSLMSISTSRSKSSPAGSFNLVLAPTRNWTATLTPGSWCAILMSNEPIDKKSLEAAKATQLKMIGRIDAVRANISVDDSGARSTTYSVQGRDWGAIFENIVYIDPIIQAGSPQGTAANALWQQMITHVYDANNSPNILAVPKNLAMIMSILGHPFKLPETERLAKATHEVTLPQKLVDFLGASGPASPDSLTPTHQPGTWEEIEAAAAEPPSTKFTELLSLISGPLETKGEDNYNNSKPEQSGWGWLDSSGFVGQHSIWSILQDNSNYAINELFTEIRWKGNSPEFRLYNRIKPFSYTDVPANEAKIDTAMRSKFQNIKSHLLDIETVVSVNAGTNWADKFNFLEIKPDLNELDSLGVTLKDKSQVYQDSAVLDREGFRPMFFSIRQLPFDKNAQNRPIDGSLLEQWVQLAQEWYFDSHKLLNGTIAIYGSSEYIPVGDNIMFDAELLGATKNHNSKVKDEDVTFVLAHVESIQNDFSVGSGGERSFRTMINFVRGILVNKDKQLVGTGTINDSASALNKNDSKNSTTVFSSKED